MALYSAAWGLVTQADATPQPIASDPLATAYAMLANLYEQHTPAIAIMPVIETSGSGAREIVIPCEPSADGLDYVFRMVGRKASGALSVTVTISEYVSSSWSAIVSSASTALGAGTDFDVEIALSPIDPASEALRLEITAAGASYQIDSIAVYPDAANITAPGGTSDSGYVGAADGLIGSSDAPLTTEHLDRLAQSTRAVYRDRYQCVFGFGQPVDRNARAVADVATYGQAKAVQFGASRLYIPHAPDGKADLTIRAYGEHDHLSGTVPVRLRFSVPGREPVVATLDLPASSPGFDAASVTIPIGLNGFCDVTMEINTASAAATKTYPYAVMGWWTP